MAPSVITRVLEAPRPHYRGGEPLDLISLADFKEEMKLKGSGDDDWLKKQISRSSAAISRFCNRTFQIERVQDEIWPFRDPYPWQLPANLMPLQLARWPLAVKPSHAGIAPPYAPELSAQTGGALAAGRYSVRVSFFSEQGETAASLRSEIWLSGSQTIVVAAPEVHHGEQATSWNCFVGLAGEPETLQNFAPLSLDEAFDVEGPLVAGQNVPPHMLVVEHAKIPLPLTEWRDFQVDCKTGEVHRVFLDGYVSKWPVQKITAEYLAGFEEVPGDIRDAAIELVKFRYFMRTRDPGVRSENVEGILQSDYWFGTGPGGPADMPAYVADKLSRYRVPVIA